MSVLAQTLFASYYAPSGGGSDPSFSDVSLLLHMDGTNGSTSFTDASTRTKTVTALGNAQISTSQSKFGGASGLFDGAGDYLSIPADVDLEFGSASATFEMFFRPNATPAVAGGLITRGNVSGFANFSISYRSTRAVEAYCSLSNSALTPVILTSSTLLTNAVWHHIAFTKDNLTYRLFIDGVLSASGTGGSHPPTGLSSATLVGSITTSSFFINGNIDELRVTKGVARYTANFTPPTAPFPDF